jgi:4-alpha-glucanotransferase
VSGVIAAAIAVIGTLFGAVVAHRYQEKSAARAADRADLERGHQRLLDACADFIALAEDYRRAQYDRWTSQHAGPDSESAIATRAESYRLYVEIRGSVFRLRLAALSPQAQRLADEAAEIQVKTREIFFATDKADMLSRGEAVEHACEAFVVRAREVLAAGA